MAPIRRTEAPSGNQKERKVIETVDDLADDILDFTCWLVAEPSTLENEASAIGVMEKKMTKLCFEPVKVPVNPAEIEDCVMKHAAVSMVAVVRSPDKLRTGVVKAFIILNPEVRPGPEIEGDIKAFVKVRLAAHEYPPEIEFVQDLPMSNTGKIMRRELRKLDSQRKKKLLDREWI